MNPTTLLHGPYRPPRTQLGDKLFCEVRGWVVVRRISDGPIPWPMGKTTRKPAMILCGDLVKALRNESATAIMHEWNVRHHTVWKWRKALGIDQYTEGTRRAKRQSAIESPRVRV